MRSSRTGHPACNLLCFTRDRTEFLRLARRLLGSHHHCSYPYRVAASITSTGSGMHRCGRGGCGVSPLRDLAGNIAAAGSEPGLMALVIDGSPTLFAASCVAIFMFDD